MMFLESSYVRFVYFDLDSGIVSILGLDSVKIFIDCLIIDIVIFLYVKFEVFKIVFCSFFYDCLVFG